MSWLTNIRLACSLCAVVGVAVYTNTLDCGFCFDDKSAIVENGDVTGQTSWVHLLWNDFWGQPVNSNTSHKSYRPLCVATFRLNYLLHELQPMGYHLVNVLLHGAVCYLYVQLCGVVFSQVWPALIAGLLFAVHPIHTEAVAGVVGRADLLAAIFFLLSFLSYHKGIVDVSHSKTGATSLCDHQATSHHKYVIYCLLFLLCAVASKEHGIMVVGLCLIYDLFLVSKVNPSDIWRFLSSHPYKGRSLFSKPFLSRTVPLVLFSVVILIGRIWLMQGAPVFSKQDNEALALDSPYRQLHWSYLIFINSYLLFHPSVLLHDYRMGAVPLIKTALDPRIMLIFITMVSYSCLLLYSFSNLNYKLTLLRPLKQIQEKPHECRKSLAKRTNGHMTNDDVIINGTAVILGTVKIVKPNTRSISMEISSHKEVLLFGISLMVVPFLPASNLFFPVGFVVAERVLYLPSMGFCMLVAYGAYRMLQTQAKWLHLIGGLGLVLLILSHCCKTLHRSRDWYSKESLYKSFVKHNPTNGHMLGNLALYWHHAGDDLAAEKLNRYAMEVAPQVPLSFVNLGSLLKQQGRLDEAEQIWKRAVDVLLKEEELRAETVAQIYSSLCSMVSSHDQRLPEALELCDLAVQTQSGIPSVHNTRGAVLTKMGRHREAKVAFEQATRLDPHNLNTAFNLALAYKNSGDVIIAMEMLQQVLAIDHSHQPARDQLKRLLDSLY